MSMAPCLLDQRFTPKWFQRHAYVQGLKDAQKIAEIQAWKYTREGMGAEINSRQILMSIQTRINEITRHER